MYSAALTPIPVFPCASLPKLPRQAHFVKNMFIRPSDEELVDFKPDFIVMNGAKCTNPQWKEQGLNSENFVAFNLTERIQLIGGTGTAAK